MNLGSIAKAAALIKFESADVKRFVDNCDDFNLDPNDIGKMFINKKTNRKLVLAGLRKIRAAWCLIVEEPELYISTTNQKFYNVMSIREFSTDYERYVNEN